ncbi:MobP2 family relaxase [Staphylococcus saprophyticus]|nr:MobP2 family relaxase [Staphylococcus saprophyticus]
MPKIVTMSEFEQSKNKTKFSKYVDYVDRDEAKKNEHKEFQYDVYTHYMFDEQKSNSMFNDNSNYMSEDEIKYTKSKFNEAQKNNGIMWKDVISFDNESLKEAGIFDPECKYLDEQKMRQATRKAMQKFEKKEGLENNLVWSSSIHYNTDNIHVHVAAVEKDVTRERGKRKYSMIKEMKSSFANELFDMSGERTKINNFIRDRIVKGIKEQNEPDYDKQMKLQLKKIHEEIKDIPKKEWQYNNNIMKQARPEIDKFTLMYIKNNHGKEFDEFKQDLKKQSKLYKETYGDKSDYKKYEETKMNDLYSRAGNTVLKQIKSFNEEYNNIKFKEINKQDNKNPLNINPKVNNKMQIGYALNSTLYNTQRALRNDFQKERNINQYHYEFDKSYEKEE